jgi:hypothetical protein
LYEGNHSPLFNEQVIKDIYGAHPHLYEDDKVGINMTGTQRDNKRRCVIRLCSNRFSAFLGLVYGDDKFETIIFAQKGKKRREAERKEAAAAKLVKTEHIFFEQETNSANQTPKNEEYPVVVGKGDSDSGICERKNQIVQIIECEDADEENKSWVTTDAVMRFYSDKNNVQFRTMAQKVHEVLVVDKPIEGLIHLINDTKEAMSFHCKQTDQRHQRSHEFSLQTKLTNK